MPRELTRRGIELWEVREVAEDGDVDRWLQQDGDGFGSLDVAWLESCCTVLMCVVPDVQGGVGWGRVGGEEEARLVPSSSRPFVLSTVRQSEASKRYRDTV